MLEKLENNEFILLMYLADELPPEDKAEVDQLLATDRGLHGQWVELRASQAGFSQTLGLLDEASPLQTSQAALVRQIGRTMRQRLAARAAPAPPKKRGLRYPWWAYPSAAVAASILAFLTWWGNVRGGGPTKLAPAIAYTPSADTSASSAEDPSVPQIGELARTWNLEDPQEHVAQAERELLALSHGSTDVESSWPAVGGEPNE